MKNNILKLLALAGALVSLAGCTTKEKIEPATDYTIDELLEIADESDETGYYPFVHEGERVRTDDMTIFGYYDHVIYLTTAVGETVGDLRGLEVHLDESVDMESVHYKDLVRATGTLSNLNGRCILEKATFEVTNAVQYDDKNNAIDGTGGSVYYWGRENFSRSGYDYLKRSNSSILVEGIFQLCENPGTITEAGAEFNVVFAGEDRDTEDDENYSLIKVEIKPGLSEKALAKLNAYFAPSEGEAPKDGDFVNILGITEYNKRKGIKIVYEEVWSRIGYPEATASEEIPAVYNGWNDAITSVKDLLKLEPELPLLSEEIDMCFSYTVDADYVDKDVADVFKSPADLIFIDSCEMSEVGFIEIHANTKSSNAYAAAKALATAFAGMDYWELGADNDDKVEGSYAAIIIGYNDDEDVTQEIYLFNDDIGVTIYFFAERAGK